MTLRPVRIVAVSVLTCAFVLAGCTSGSGSASGAAGASTRQAAPVHALRALDDLPSTRVWK